jgi:hypothetical protein
MASASPPPAGRRAGEAHLVDQHGELLTAAPQASFVRNWRRGESPDVRPDLERLVLSVAPPAGRAALRQPARLAGHAAQPD